MDLLDDLDDLDDDGNVDNPAEIEERTKSQMIQDSAYFNVLRRHSEVILRSMLTYTGSRDPCAPTFQSVEP